MIAVYKCKEGFDVIINLNEVIWSKIQSETVYDNVIRELKCYKFQWGCTEENNVGQF